MDHISNICNSRFFYRTFWIRKTYFYLLPCSIKCYGRSQKFRVGRITRTTHFLFWPNPDFRIYLRKLKHWSQIWSPLNNPEFKRNWFKVLSEMLISVMPSDFNFAQAGESIKFYWKGFNKSYIWIKENDISFAGKLLVKFVHLTILVIYSLSMTIIFY